MENKEPETLYEKLCSRENIEIAWKRARKRKTLKKYVIDFEKNLKENLDLLRTELLLHSYIPLPLTSFIIRDPKTRKISKSDFRDRIVHHALCNVIEPIFEKIFIHDSYANRTGKGTLKAIKRFDHFKRKVSRNNTKTCFVLKADIKHYFDTVSHPILLNILRKKIKDEKLIQLIKLILNNFNKKTKENSSKNQTTHGLSEPEKKGMPLGNLTSQFFANVYLNELDQYIKHQLKAKYYIRYVDDFVILHNNKSLLDFYKIKINLFLKENLNLALHPQKSKIISLSRGISFLGFRNFYYHRLLKKSNIRKLISRLNLLEEKYKRNEIDYDSICSSFEGWLAYAKNADTFRLRSSCIKTFESFFPGKMSSKDINQLVQFIDISPVACPAA